MSMEELIVAVIEKVRKMYQYDTRIGDIVKQNATVTLVENEGKLELHGITFNWYDSVSVGHTQITYHPEHGISQAIIKYRDLYQLLEL